jgi:hypothetical protein
MTTLVTFLWLAIRWSLGNGPQHAGGSNVSGNYIDPVESTPVGPLMQVVQ